MPSSLRMAMMGARQTGAAVPLAVEPALYETSSSTSTQRQHAA
jgi:hypothetical protein